MIILGLDPSLSCTGWGVIRVEGSRIGHIANGQVKTDAKAPLPDRLAHLDTVLAARSEEHTSELQLLMRISYAVFCLKKKTQNQNRTKKQKSTIDNKTKQ